MDLFTKVTPTFTGCPPEQILQDVFGFRAFRPFQRDVVEGLIRGEDGFVLMPTGGGKSLCYQIPALARPGVGIVVSPLISLMKDQVDSLSACGVRAAFYNSSLAASDARTVLAKLHQGDLDLLYVAPERLMSADFLERLKGIQVALFAIDEAHCVSQWGHDFRPDYVQLGQLRNHFPQVPVLALTATADPQTRDDIRRRLKIEQAPCFLAGFDRPNIRYTVQEKSQPMAQLNAFLRDRSSESGIIYALSRKRVEEVAAHLIQAGYQAAPYHAGLQDEERRSVQNRFLQDDLQIVVATVAFGMGIDKSNVRYVVHYDLPRNIESYYQETGRAGRDGLESEALLLFGYGDIALSRGLIENGRNPDQNRIEVHKLNAMAAFAEAQSCRRRVLLGYFGEELATDCGNCDICLNPPEHFDATEDAQKALSCVYRVGQRFGIGHVIDVLRGSNAARIKQLGHNRLSTWGIGKERSKEDWGNILRQLIHHGYLQQDMARYSVLTLTEKARPLLRGECSLTLALPRQRPRKTVKTQPTGAMSYDLALFARLKDVRKGLAQDQGVPPFVILSDASLAEMAAALPQNDLELLAINGMGPVKLKRYGDAFLNVLRTHTPSTS